MLIIEGSWINYFMLGIIFYVCSYSIHLNYLCKKILGNRLLQTFRLFGFPTSRPLSACDQYAQSNGQAQKIKLNS